MTNDTHAGPDPAMIEDALRSLAAPRHEVAAAFAVVPDKAGLYAIYAPRTRWQQLGVSCDDDRLPLYVGKAERSLVARDLKTHFATGRTGSSTLRRSFAALLRGPLGLRGVPRNVRKPERPANYGLSPEDDARLTQWMKENLSLAVWVKPFKAPLDQIETAVLAVLQPPLNLSKIAAPSVVLRAARKTMADDVRAWAKDRGLEL